MIGAALRHSALTETGTLTQRSREFSLSRAGWRAGKLLSGSLALVGQSERETSPHRQKCGKSGLKRKKAEAFASARLTHLRDAGMGIRFKRLPEKDSNLRQGG